MDKYIFLDFDGVITTKASRYCLDPDKCELLGNIIKVTGAKLVISSSWRKHTLEDTIQYLSTYVEESGYKFPFCDSIVGVTIRAYHYLDKSNHIHLSIPRGVEIKQWIDANIHSDNGKTFHHKTLGVDYQYVILDDDSDMLLEHANNFIKTDTYLGLSNLQADFAILILNNKL